MSKVLNVYSNKVDKVWYLSSNIKYSECIDYDNELKTLKVVFNNGTQYQYNGVNVNHYLMFREDASQGKALNRFIKGNNYEYVKLDDANINEIESELNFRMEGGYFMEYDGETLIVKDNKDVVLCSREIKLTEEAFDTIYSIIRSMGHDVRVKKGDTFYLIAGESKLECDRVENEDTRHIYGGIG